MSRNKHAVDWTHANVNIANQVGVHAVITMLPFDLPNVVVHVCRARTAMRTEVWTFL